MFCLFVCLYVHAWYLWKPEEDIESSGTGVTDSCEVPCAVMGTKLHPLEAQQVFLTAAASLQHLLVLFVWFCSYFCFFQDKVSLCGLGCPRTSFVDQTGPKLTETHLPLLLPPKCWN